MPQLRRKQKKCAFLFLNSMNPKNITLRREPCRNDPEKVRNILLSTGKFHSHEIDVALELIRDRLEKGEKSEYFFIFAERGDETPGYVCYGPITMAEERFDIYWIAVHEEAQGKGIGAFLARETEKSIMESGGRYIFVETSSREIYKATRSFYRKQGYDEVACIPDYYADNDDKVVLRKKLF